MKKTLLLIFIFALSFSTLAYTKNTNHFFLNIESAKKGHKITKLSANQLSEKLNQRLLRAEKSLNLNSEQTKQAQQIIAQFCNEFQSIKQQGLNKDTKNTFFNLVSASVSNFENILEQDQAAKFKNSKMYQKFLKLENKKQQSSNKIIY